jgi:predicted nucleotidyltransferase
MGKARIEIPKEKIAEFCKKWQVREFAVFGSILRDDFRTDSDIDAIVDFVPDSCHSLFDLVDMTEELEKIFNRKVDLLTRRGVEESRNYIRRKEILSTLEVLYVS